MSSYEEIEQREAAMEDNSRRVRATEYEELMEFLDKENFCKSPDFDQAGFSSWFFWIGQRRL